MFVVTNRNVFPNRASLKAFGALPNPAGPHELRLAEANKTRGKWSVRILPDQVTAAMAKDAGLKLKAGEKAYASRYVAAKLLARINPTQGGSGRNFVLFVHGFNNDLEAALDRAHDFEQTYNVEVLVFSWPANGGGAKGVASYLSDKRDAMASVGAFGRVLEKLKALLLEAHASYEAQLATRADQRHGDNDEAWLSFYTQRAEARCPFTVNLVLHSMGNYLFKKALGTSAFRAALPIFDNVVLVAADTNSEDHAAWVEEIKARRRVLITINEHDIALAASQLKMGEQQKARLGHYLFGLNARNATYLNFTDAAKVGRSHAYFEGDPLQNEHVRRAFMAAFNGEAPERELRYNSARNYFEVP